MVCLLCGRSGEGEFADGRWRGLGRELAWQTLENVQENVFLLKIFGQFKKLPYLCTRFPKERVFLQKFECKQAMIAQLVEHDLAKVGVASSSLVHRSSAGHAPAFVF